MKRIYKSGAAKKALLAKQSSSFQKKISFPILERVTIVENNTKNTVVDEMLVSSCMDDNHFNANNSNAYQNSNIINFIRPLKNDSIAIKNNFFSKHPIQSIMSITEGKLNFKRIFYKELPNGKIVQRKWISYCIETECLYCSNCMAIAYGKPVSYGEKESKFISGYKSDIKMQKCLYRDIVNHENSIFHQNSSCTAVRFQLNKDIEKVLERLIDIVIFIGLQRIPYRGKYEAAYALRHVKENHGSFLELVMLIAKYDTILNQHVNKSITLSEKAKSKKGRGSLITFIGIVLFNLLKEELQKLRLMLNDIVACSFDGAANMKGIYNGLQAHLKSVNSNIVYTHCMGHVLNLVRVTVVGTNINLAEDLFDSHKRMETWTSITSVKHTGHDKLYKLQKIGATRWWSKDKALRIVMDLQLNILETNKEVENAIFATLLTFLTTVCHGNFNTQSKFIAKSLITTTPVSIYLQTKTINYLQAWNMIAALKKEIEKKRTDEYVLNLYEKCQYFCKKINNHFCEEDLINIEVDFPIKHTIKNSIESRFMKNENLLKDLNWLDPRSFTVFNNIKISPESILSTLCKMSGLNHVVIVEELKQFSSQYEKFIPQISKYATIATDCDSKKRFSNDEDNDEISKTVYCNKCSKCIHCAFLIVRELSRQSNLFVIYKFALLLPSTQTTCERVFSKLKCIKTKLRSTLHQNHLSPLILMAIENNIVLDTQNLIETIAYCLCVTESPYIFF
ncbi:hypothetical protein QTP88_013020 [Uroleucon formosanum]